jgi:lysophospholipase L1-like esterase
LEFSKLIRSSSQSTSTRRQLLRAGLAAGLGSWAALELIAADRAGAEPASPASTRRISVVGDSLTIGTMPYQSDDFRAAGWSRTSIDAYAGRGVRTKLRRDLHTGLTAVDAIRDSWGDTDAWIVGLGTNDAVIYPTSRHALVIEQMMERIGRGHRVMWINVVLPQRAAAAAAWNVSLDEVAALRDDMYVLDWAGLALQNPRWISTDGVHCSAAGYRNRSDVVAGASRYLHSANTGSPIPAQPAESPTAEH